MANSFFFALFLVWCSTNKQPLIFKSLNIFSFFLILKTKQKTHRSLHKVRCMFFFRQFLWQVCNTQTHFKVRLSLLLFRSFAWFVSWWLIGFGKTYRKRMILLPVMVYTSCNTLVFFLHQRCFFLRGFHLTKYKWMDSVAIVKTTCR